MQPCFRTDKEYESPLHEYRVAQGLTIAELTRKTGVTQQYISGLANGMISPLLQDGRVRPCAAKLCEFFNVDMEDLFPRYICSLNRAYKFDVTDYETYSERIADSSYDNFENIEYVHSLLQNTPLSTQQIIMLHMYFYKEMTLREISEKLDICLYKIRSRLVMTLKKIREYNKESLLNLLNSNDFLQITLS